MALCGTQLSRAGGNRPTYCGRAHLAPGPTHLPGSEGDRRPPFNEQLSHLKVAAVESIVQGSDALTALAARVVHRGPVVQQEADDVCGTGNVSQRPAPCSDPSLCVTDPWPTLTQMPVVAGLMQGCPTTVVPRVQGVTL